MEGQENTARLGVVDKRILFNSLIAMVDRLLFLNKFPVNQVDFALSCHPPEVEAAWRLLSGDKSLRTTLTFGNMNWFACSDRRFQLHLYPDESTGHRSDYVFMQLTTRNTMEIPFGNKYQVPVKEWAVRQLRLEDQILRADKVIKAIVHSCNTVGQYKRVSPDLLTFLPEKYRLALKDYTKQSPYPAITVEPEEIETTMAALAYASLQPTHSSEEEYSKRASWGHRTYTLAPFPRTAKFNSSEHRNLEL